jgi:hypothetical protein
LVVVMMSVGVGSASATVTTAATFSSLGSYSFTVPVGVTNLALQANGGPGGSCGGPPSESGAVTAAARDTRMSDS